MRSMSENIPSDLCAQRRLRSACGFSQSDQNSWRILDRQGGKVSLHANNEDSDQSARMHRLISVGRTCQKVRCLATVACGSYIFVFYRYYWSNIRTVQVL